MSGSQSAPPRTFVFDIATISNTATNTTVQILQYFNRRVIVPRTLTNFLLNTFSDALPDNLALYQERLRRFSFEKIVWLHEVFPDDLAVYQEFLDRTEGPIVESSRNLNALLQRPDILREDYEERLADFRAGLLYPPMLSALILTDDALLFQRGNEAGQTPIDNRQYDVSLDTDNETHTSKRQKVETRETRIPSEIINPIDHLGAFLSKASSSNSSTNTTQDSGDEDLEQNEGYDPCPSPRVRHRSFDYFTGQPSSSLPRAEDAQAVAVPSQNTALKSLTDPTLLLPGTSSTPVGNNDLFIGRAQIPQSASERRVREAIEREQEQEVALPPPALGILRALNLAASITPDAEVDSDSDSVHNLQPIVTMGIPPPGYRSRSNSRARMTVALPRVRPAGYAEATIQRPMQSTPSNEVVNRGRTAGRSSSTRSRVSRPPMRPEREDSSDDHPLLPTHLLRPGTWRGTSEHNSSVLDPSPYSIQDASRQANVERRRWRAPSPYPQVDHIENIEQEGIHSERETTGDDSSNSADNEHLLSRSSSPQPHVEHVEDVSLEQNATPAENRDAAQSNGNGEPNRPALGSMPLGLPQPPMRIMKASVPGPNDPEAIFGELQDFSNQNIDPGLGQTLPERLSTRPEGEEEEPTQPTQSPLRILTTTQFTQTVEYRVNSPAGALRPSPVDYHDRRGIDEHLHVGNHRWTGDGHYPAPSPNVSSHNVDISYGEVEDIEIRDIASPRVEDEIVVQIREIASNHSDLGEYNEFAELLRTADRRRVETVEQARRRIANRDKCERFVGLNGWRMTPAPSRHSIEEDFSLWKRCVNKVKKFFRRRKDGKD